MKKSILLFLFLANFIIFSSSLFADSYYKKYVWKSTFDKKTGVLKVQGAGHNPWQFKWIVVSTNVVQYSEAGTTLGPVIIYLDKYKTWKIVRLKFDTGKLENIYSFNKPITIVRTATYGVIISVGNDLYDYSWYQCKKL